MKRLVLTAVILLFHLISLPQASSPPTYAWDLKRSCQPVITRLADPVKGLPGVGIRVFNNYTSNTLSHLVLEWEVTLNGIVVQKGKVGTLVAGAQRWAVVRLPVKVPEGPGEVLLTVYYRMKKKVQEAAVGELVATEQLSVRKYVADLFIKPAGDLGFSDEGGVFTVTSTPAGLNMQFNKQTGWLQHSSVGGRAMLEDTVGLLSDVPKTAANDWRLQLFSTSTSTDMVIVKADYMLSETPWLLHERYTINARGEMQVDQLMEMDSTVVHDTTGGTAGLSYPTLFGMTWGLPAGFDSVVYDGPGHGPGALNCNPMEYTGVYRQAVDEAGTATDIRWWKAMDKQGHGMQITADSSFLIIVWPRHERGLKIGVPFGDEKKERYHYIYKVGPL